MGKDTAALTISFNKSERARVEAIASSLGLTPGSFVRGVTVGAMTIGGATLDRVLVVGGQNTPLRSPSTDWTKFFPTNGTDPQGFNLREFKDDPKWFLVKPTRKGDTSGSDDPDKWWHLRCKFTNLNVPLAWDVKEACKLAQEQIEKLTKG